MAMAVQFSLSYFGHYHLVNLSEVHPGTKLAQLLLDHSAKMGGA